MYHLVKHELGSGCGIWLALAWRWHISGNETNSSCSRTYCGTNRSSLNIDHGWKIIFHRWSLLKSLLSAKLAASWCPWQALQGGFVLPAMLGHSGMDWAHLAWSTPTQVGWEVHQMLLQSEISVLQPHNGGWLCCLQTRVRSVVELSAARSSLTAWQLWSASGTVTSPPTLISAGKVLWIYLRLRGRSITWGKVVKTRKIREQLWMMKSLFEYSAC